MAAVAVAAVAVAVAKPSTLSPKSIEHMGTANNTENKYNYVLTSDFHAVMKNRFSLHYCEYEGHVTIGFGQSHVTNEFHGL